MGLGSAGLTNAAVDSLLLSVYGVDGAASINMGDANHTATRNEE